MPDCMVPENQLLQNLYVDYFHSVGPCMTPDGYQVHTFRNSEYAGTASTYTYTTVCAKLPKICNLLRRPRGRSLVSMGEHMVDSFTQNMNFLYGLLTGRGGGSTSHQETQQGTSRFATTHHQQETSAAERIDCSHGQCSHRYEIAVCEIVEDVAFPVVGRSAITNASVTILQDYPDRVQPIFFRKCRSYKSQVIYGRCIQEYLPVSVYVSSHYDDSVLSQDFVMVESGCHVIADITYNEWKNEVMDTPYYYTERRSQHSEGNNQTNGTWSPIDPMKAVQKETKLENQPPFPTTTSNTDNMYVEEGQRRRTSDRRLFSRG